ncbi:hypothetical protein HYS95_00500 [Candidatus Daviesbacteria bacterium]|nr:hypothetical protein [Candidatus Daviesbacteria bacterium]
MRVHFLGIGGSGASAAAKIAEAQGFEVTGCDLEPDNEFTSVFKPHQLLKGHSPQHLYCHPERLAKDLPRMWVSNKCCETTALQRRDSSSMTPQNDNLIDILAVTPAIYSLDPDNDELREARKREIGIMTWQQFLGQHLTKNQFVIAVAGTHGKTTTTAMIAKILEDANLDPTVELGAIIPKWGTNYRIPIQKPHDRGFIVIEADEFNDNFLSFKPDITVVTNIEMDHPEYFKDFEAVKTSFKKFLLQTKNTIFANLSDTTVAEIIKVVMKESKITCFDYSNNEQRFNLKIPGHFNQLNASAAFKVGLMLGIEPQVIKDSLESFTGAGRRFEYIGEYNEAKVYSDFGHHPTEIEKTMEAVREKFPKERVLLIYQPHMFSRTKALFEDFVKVFKNIPADKTFIIDIYPSREIDTGQTSSKELVSAIDKEEVIHAGSASEVLEKIKPEIKEGDILFFMSAGDTDKLAKELVG